MNLPVTRYIQGGSVLVGMNVTAFISGFKFQQGENLAEVHIINLWDNGTVNYGVFQYASDQLDVIEIFFVGYSASSVLKSYYFATNFDQWTSSGDANRLFTITFPSSTVPIFMVGVHSFYFVNSAPNIFRLVNAQFVCHQ
jgi:hypothetical protein